MSLTGGIILFAVIWFMVFLMVLPIRYKSQAEAGHVVPGTPSSAPDDAQILRKARITTIITAVLWAICAYVLLSGMFTLRDIDWFDRLGPESGSVTTGD
jgi:predicted secreted protein